MKLKDGFNGERAFVLPPSCVDALESHPLSAALHMTDIGYYPCAAHHYRRREEPISQYVMIYCKSGRGWFEVGGRHREVGPDTYFILPPGEKHAYGTCDDNPWSIYWIHFKGSLAAEYAGPAGEPVALKPSHTSRISYRLEMFDEMMGVLDHGYILDNMLYCCSLLHHFLGSLRFVRQYRGDCGKSAVSEDIVSAAINYMKENLDRPLKLGEVAEYVGYSMSQLSHTFTNATGQSPMMYANQLRINKACSLLDFTDLHINQICYRVGITDPYYFSRLFRRIMGMSPSAYRRVKKG